MGDTQKTSCPNPQSHQPLTFTLLSCPLTRMTTTHRVHATLWAWLAQRPALRDGGWGHLFPLNSYLWGPWVPPNWLCLLAVGHSPEIFARPSLVRNLVPHPSPHVPLVQGWKTAWLMFGLSFGFVFIFPTLANNCILNHFSTTALNQFICVVCHQNVFITYKLI